MKPSPELKERVRAEVRKVPFLELLSLELADFGDGRSEMVLEIADKHQQNMGIVHGGVLASMVDAATYWAAFSSLEDTETLLISADLAVQYLAPARAGTLTARGRTIKSGRRLSYAEAEIHAADGTLVAHGTSTLMPVG